MAGRSIIYSIGHSSHSFEAFAALLRQHGVTAIADVRSAPYSKFCPHFSQGDLKINLQNAGISYVFLGKELGGRPSRPAYFKDGKADYEKMAKDQSYQAGLKRLEDGGRKFNIALMCSEQDPLDCHRCLLVSRSLLADGIDVRHILSDGSLLTQHEIEDRLITMFCGASGDLFMPAEEQLGLAYQKRATQIAFAADDDQKLKQVS